MSAPPPSASQRSRTALLRAFFSVMVAGGLLVLKLKGFLLLMLGKARWLLVNPFEGFGATQFAMAGGSMVVSVAAYAWKMGFPFALGFVILTVVHEIGHAVVIRAKGLRAGAMVFIPFVGGAVTLRDQPRSAFDDAQIGLAGPIAGTLAALVCYAIYEWRGSVFFLALAFAGFLLNLLNLMPIGPLDGGRISAAVTKWMWVLGAIALCWIMLTWKSPLLIGILIVSAMQIYRAIQLEKGDTFYEVTAMQRFSVGVVYFLLVIFLGLATMAAHEELEALRALL